MDATCVPADFQFSAIFEIACGSPSSASNGSRRKSTCWIAHENPADRNPLNGLLAMPTMSIAVLAIPNPAVTQSPLSTAATVPFTSLKRFDGSRPCCVPVVAGAACAFIPLPFR